MKKIFTFLLTSFVFLCVSFAEKTPIKSLYAYKLDNGLSLFVAENHTVPLTYIEIAVRCGSYTQDADNVGVFHLYEHMMFKGNSLYKSAAELDRATSDMGVSDRNGSTSLECVNYFFTVPSDLTEKGLEFWNAAIRFPNLDKKEFENEKKVVIAEINGDASDLGHKIARSSMDLLFGDYPYTTDPAGTEESIKKATVKQLKAMLKKYYIPNNSALFVAGDVNPDEVFEMTKKIFGSWKRGSDPFSNGIVRHSKEPFTEPEFRVQPYDKIAPELASITVEFRGPDAGYDIEDTYAADILSEAFSLPNGYFKTVLSKNPLLEIPDPEYVYGGYPTRKTCGSYSFGATVIEPTRDLPARAQYFLEQIYKITQDVASSLSDKEFSAIENRLEDDRIIMVQTAKGLISTLRFWWTVADENYFYTYIDKMKGVNNEDLIYFVDKYFTDKKPLVRVLVNPSVYEKTKEQFEKEGFKLLFEE